MAKQADVLIIGGGVIGVCAAYYLVERGRSVTLVEKGEICSGSSYGNAGLIVPSHSVPLAAPGVIKKGLRWMFNPESPFYIKFRLDPALWRWLWRFRAACNTTHMHRAMPVIRDLSLSSIALYEELAALEGLEFGYQRRGSLYLFRTQAGYAEGKEEAHLLEQIGVTVKILEGSALRELEPEIESTAIGGIYFPDDAHLNPASFVRGLATFVAQKGGTLWEQTEVLGFETHDRRIVRVQTTRGDFSPQQVVLAGGSWSPLLARDLHFSLPIQPAKGYSITVKRPTPCPGIPLMLSEAKVAVTPLGEMLRFAGTLELAGLDLSINRRRVSAILRAIPQYLPQWKEFEILEIWRGLRPCTPDGLPCIGPAPTCENLIVAAGHAMIGISLGPITGKLVAQLLTGETPDFDLAPLRVERFA
ncbi:MAG: FAD-dependent oxidoreductase [Nitrospinota bacterium]|nr:MAG: FAD-dependent oxidoreductase [Nitrospinota bacterium]